jgi:hypothetical protein
MELWLSRSLSHELFLFSRWNFGYHEAILTNFSFFTMEFWLSGSLSHELFLFSRWNFGYLEAFLTNFSFLKMDFSRHEIRNTQIGGRLFSYIYIYIRKSIYIGSASLKTLPLDLEPPLQGKEYGPSYSNTTRKRKADFFFRNYL